MDATTACHASGTSSSVPWTAGATGLTACFPPWSAADGKLFDNLKDPATRARMKSEMIATNVDWENLGLQAGPENVGELVRLIAATPRTGVYNCGDPDPPTVLEIARAIAAAADHRFCELLLPDPVGRGTIGATPWSVPKPLLVDMTKAERDLGYRPATRWQDALPRQVDWLLGATQSRAWQEVLPRGAEYLRFDYEAEDELVRSLAA